MVQDFVHPQYDTGSEHITFVCALVLGQGLQYVSMLNVDLLAASFFFPEGAFWS